MKKTALVLMVLIVSTLASAQRGENSQRQNRPNGERMSLEDRQAQELVQLTEALSLSDKQVVEVKKLQDTLSVGMQEMRSTMTQNTDRKVMHEKMQQLRENHETNIKTLLSDEQKEKYKAYIAKRKEEMRQHQRPDGYGMGGRPEKESVESQPPF